jgi:hypothetical protein
VRANDSTDQRPRQTNERGYSGFDKVVISLAAGTALGAAYFGVINTAGIVFDVNNGALNSVISGSQSTLKAVFVPTAIAGAIPGIFIGEIIALNMLPTPNPGCMKIAASAAAGLVLGGFTSGFLSYGAALLGQLTLPQHLAHAIAATSIKDNVVESAAAFNCAVARLGVVGGAEIGFLVGLTYVIEPAILSCLAQIRENRPAPQISVV